MSYAYYSNSQLAVVTPTSRPTSGWCSSRLQGLPCSCFRARLQQLCQCCHRLIGEDHCIQNNGAGWVHVRCQGDEQRGLPSIQRGFQRVRTNDAFPPLEDERPSVVRRLTFSTGDAPTAAAAGGNQGNTHNEPETGGAMKIVEDEEEDDDNGPSRFTDEQQRIRDHTPDFGGWPVCVNALAGCGKTTTIAAISNKLQETHPRCNKLYLVFNKKNQDEAMDSGKFPKDRMEIRTTHAFVLRHYFGTKHMFSFTPTGDYDLKDIQDQLKLQEEMRRIFPQAKHNSRKFQRKVNSVASYVRETIHNFQASSDLKFSDQHVFWRAKKNTNLTARSKWRKKIPLEKYKEWAAEYFAIVDQRCHLVRDSGTEMEGITFDGYLKLAQVEQRRGECDLMAGFQIVIVDEAQDFTPCQADLFWGSPIARRGKAIYLFGDRYQQLYRFRGAGHSFSDMWEETRSRYSLTGSFRFGKNIARTANVVLQALGAKEPLCGRAIDDGEIHDGEKFDGKGVVLCRTNCGMYRHLFFNKPTKWCYLGGSKKAFPKPPGWVYDLEQFLRYAKEENEDDEADLLNPGGDDEERSDDESPRGSCTFKYKAERFSTIDEIKSYIDDEGDSDLRQYLGILQFLKAANQGLDDFILSIKKSFSPLQGEPDLYGGTVLGTVHKAKGLEFSKVLISNDYRFKVIQNVTASEMRRCDEANILYVAITRSKKHIFLSQEARNCLNLLEEKLGNGEDGSFVEKLQEEPKSCNSASRKQIRDTAEEAWAAFKSTKPEIKYLLDVAWPSGKDMDLLPLDHRMTETEQRRYIRTLLLRYHPDKFFPAYEHLICGDELRNQIKDKLCDILRQCQEALRALQDPEES